MEIFTDVELQIIQPELSYDSFCPVSVATTVQDPCVPADPASHVAVPLDIATGAQYCI